MSFNGSGLFVRLYNWVNDAAAGINIRADRMDGEMDGFATGLSDCVTRDGQSPPTANLPMGGFRHTGAMDGIALTDYASVNQVQTGAPAWIAGGGGADAITAAYVPAITTLTDGMLLSFRATAANATTTPTFSPNGLTAHTITKSAGRALAVGEIPRALYECVIRYNLANTRWELLNPGLVSSGTVATVSGVAATMFSATNMSGVWMLYAYIAALNDVVNYGSISFIFGDGGGTFNIASERAAPNMTFSQSGGNVQVTQVSGGPVTITWILSKFGI